MFLRVGFADASGLQKKAPSAVVSTGAKLPDSKHPRPGRQLSLQVFEAEIRMEAGNLTQLRQLLKAPRRQGCPVQVFEWLEA
jgi:hypothetical protein